MRTPDGYRFVPARSWHLALLAAFYFVAWLVWSALGWHTVTDNTNCAGFGEGANRVSCGLAFVILFAMYFLWWLVLPLALVLSALGTAWYLRRGERSGLPFGLSLCKAMLATGAAFHALTWLFATGVPARFARGLHADLAVTTPVPVVMAIVAFALLGHLRQAGRWVAILVLALWIVLAFRHRADAASMLHPALLASVLAGHAAMIAYLLLPRASRALR